MNEEQPAIKSIGDIVREQEVQYIRGYTLISEHVRFSLRETINMIEAYMNSRHTSGEFDSLGREKPFFNIVIAAANIWMRSTDIDRANIHIRAVKQTDWLDAFLATVHLQEWMRRANFGTFLNEWGRTLARFGSAVTKFVKNSKGLNIRVVPFNDLIFDAVDFENNPVIEILQLTEGQLRERIQTMGYDPEQVKALLTAKTQRKTISRQTKDYKADYYKLYEIHLLGSKELLTKDPKDRDTFVQQMHVISYLGRRGGGNEAKYQDFTLYAGEESESPYRMDSLIKEDGRSLGIGAVEHMFQAQWQVNHSTKSIRDTLDLSSKLLFQTADAHMLGRNVLTDIETGDIVVMAQNMNLTQVNTAKVDSVTGWSTYNTEWQEAAHQIVNVTDAMLGQAPRSGTSWRLQQMELNQSENFFKFLIQNKGLAIEDMMRHTIIPYLKTQMDNADEISATLSDYGISEIESSYIKHEAIKRYNERTTKQLFANIRAFVDGGKLSAPLQPFDQAAEEGQVQLEQAQLGSKRFFKPSDLDDRSWKEQFKDLEWEVEVDVTGENQDTQGMMSTLSTALQFVVNPTFQQNPTAQALVGRILALTDAMSPVEYAALPQPQPAPQPAAAQPRASASPPQAQPAAPINQ